MVKLIAVVAWVATLSGCIFPPPGGGGGHSGGPGRGFVDPRHALAGCQGETLSRAVAE